MRISSSFPRKYPSGLFYIPECFVSRCRFSLFGFVLSTAHWGRSPLLIITLAKPKDIQFMVLNGFDVQLRLFAVKVKVTLRLTVSQSISQYVLVSSPIWGPFITVWQLRSCSCEAPFLTRGLVCLLYMLLALASAVLLGSEFLGTRDHILLSQIWDFPFRRLLRLAGSQWRYSTPPPHRFLTGIKPDDKHTVCCRLVSGFIPVKKLWIIPWFRKHHLLVLDTGM
jgi:hypothetical protein